MQTTEMRKGDTITNLLQMASRMRLAWKGTINYKGFGMHKSHCYGRIFTDGNRAVVVLTELKSNRGTSVTNDYEGIATLLRAAVCAFIPDQNFPSQVTWIEQYEERPAVLDKVTLIYEPSSRCFVHPPKWVRLNDDTVRELGVPLADLITVEPV